MYEYWHMLPIFALQYLYIFLSPSPLFKSHFGGVGGRLAETSCDARARRRLRKWGVAGI